MDIKEFLKTKRSENCWFPINVTLKPNGTDEYEYPKYDKILEPIYHDLYKGKTSNGYNTNKPLPSDFKLRPEIIKPRQDAYYNGEIKCNAIWIDTSVFHQVDQDAPDIHEGFEQALEGIPYYKSISKEYGKHFFVNVNNVKFHGTKTNYNFKKINDESKMIDEKCDKLEYLCGRPAYCDIDAVVYNSEYDYDTNKPTDYEHGLYGNIKLTENKNITDFIFTDDTEKNVSKLLNRMFKLNISWKIEKNYDRYIIYPCASDVPCLLDPTHTHGNQYKHSIIYINKNNLMVNCMSHGSKKLFSKHYSQIEDIKVCLGLKLSKEKKDIIANDFDIETEIEVEDEYLEKLLYGTTTTHKCVAGIFYHFYPKSFVCTTDDKTRCWYYYENGMWDECGSSKLRKFISHDFVNILKNYVLRAKQIEEDSNTDRNRIQYYENIQDTLKQIIIKCETVGYTDSLIKQLLCYYVDKNFISNLDTNELLLCFGEDVYDLEKCEWRKSKQDDMLSFKCGLTKDEVTDENEDEMMDIINSIFTDEDRKNYFLDTLARDILCANNKKQNFHLWTGIGGNGKGVIASYIKAILGDYYFQTDAGLITQKRGASENATPVLARTRGKRCVMLTEPEKRSKLNIGYMNYLSGEREIEARGLFKDSSSLKVTFTCFIQCNLSFKMEEIEDNSLPRRLSFVKFNTKFTDKPKYSYERKGDSNVNSIERLTKLKGSFMNILLKRWKKISQNKNLDIHIPQCVKDDKKEFINDNDLIHTFVESNIEKTDDKNDYLQVCTILERYYQWVEDEQEQTERYKSSVFINRLHQYLPRFEKRYYLTDEYGKRREKRNTFTHCKFKNLD